MALDPLVLGVIAGPPRGIGFTFNFFVEDTGERCYRDVITFLLQRGGKRVPYVRKCSKLEKRRIPSKNLPLLLWTLNEKDIDFADLETFQVCNHFEGIGQLTTKRGFCELLREMQWISQEPLDISPRCYNLGDPLHRDEFVEDFKLNAAIMVLKCALKAACLRLASSAAATSPTPSSSSPASSSSSGFQLGSINFPYSMLRTCLLVCCRYLRIKREGEWPGVERTLESLDTDTGQVNVYLTDGPEWTTILQTTYAVAEQNLSVHTADMHSAWHLLYRALQGGGCKGARAQRQGDPIILRVWLVLQALRGIHRQFDMDGSKNIWVVKAPDASCGLGLKVLYRIEDILECERGMGGRTVQKYVENPLLAPLQIAAQPSSPSRSPSRHGRRPPAAPPDPIPQPPQLMKFDLRVWVVVTCFEPLHAHVYPRVYGRRCSSPYNDNTKCLGDSMMHLTNYSIQRRNVGGADAAENGAGAVGTGRTGDADAKPDKASVRKLRSVCDSFRADGKDKDSRDGRTAREQDLLVPHDEILRVVNCHGSYRETRWDEDVWPVIKRKIYATLEATKNVITPRERSFEFLGYDVILDDALTPWILEVNMSPAMAHRSAAQSALIADMVEGLMKLAVIPSTGELEKVDGTPAPFCVDLFDRADEFDRGFTDSCAALGPALGIAPEVGGAEMYRWEPLEDPEDAARKLEPLLPRQPKPAPLQSRFTSEWSEKTPAPVVQGLPASGARPRPKSASGTSRPSSGAGFSFASNTSNAARFANGAMDVSFAVVGHVITHRTIDVHDMLCVNFGKVLLLQSWFRQRLVRLRRFHEVCRAATTTIQALVRGFLGKRLLFNLRRFRAARSIQCLARRRAAYGVLVRRRCRRAATRVQTRIRVVLAKRRLERLCCLRAARQIQRWSRYLFNVWRRKAAFKIVVAARAWLAYRRRNARIVFHLIALHFRRRVRAAKQVQFRVRLHIARRKETKRLRLVLAEGAARKGREWTLAAMERRRAWDQAVSIKLEILMYNEIYAMATELAVECYSAAVHEAAEEEAVQAAAVEEIRLAREAASLAANPLSPGERARTYTEMLRQFDLGSTSLPFGSALMRSPVNSGAGAAQLMSPGDRAVMSTLGDFAQVYNQQCAEKDIGDGDNDYDDEEVLDDVLCRGRSSALTPQEQQRHQDAPIAYVSSPADQSERTQRPDFRTQSPRSSTEQFPGMQHVQEYQSSMQAQCDMRLKMLNFLSGDRGRAETTDGQNGTARRCKSAQGSRTGAKFMNSPSRPPPLPDCASHIHNSNPPPAVRNRPNSVSGTRAGRKEPRGDSMPALARFPKYVQGTSSSSTSKLPRSARPSQAAELAGQEPEPEPGVKKKKNKATKRRVYMPAPWEEAMHSMNPYSFPSAPPVLSSVLSAPWPLYEVGDYWSQPVISSTEHPPPRREPREPRLEEAREYRAVEARLETERSALLHTMLSGMLPAKGPATSAHFQHQHQEYNFSSTRAHQPSSYYYK